MSRKFQNKQIIPRYNVVAFIMLAAGIAIIVKASYIALAERTYWMKVAARLKKDSVDVKPIRGNILSCDGRLMAGSLPEYRLYMDFKAGGEKKDSLWQVKLDSICQWLHDIFPEKSAETFRTELEAGRKQQSRNWPIWPRRVSYDVYSEVKRLPVFSLSPYKGGFHVETFNARQRPFGSLAQRTVGDMFGAKDTARCGLELSFDSILRGKIGKMKRVKVMNKYLSITTQEPINGADIVTTIDVSMQDLAERALLDMLRQPDVNGNVGVAVVMEVKTGDVKAIVNMTKCEDGVYREVKNDAVADLLEPGSVFKTASLMVALDDGVADTANMVDTGSGIWEVYGAKMKDHNWHRGGYQTISLARAIEVSSNIGISKVIDKHYSRNPEKFVAGLSRIGIRENLRLPLVGAAAPRIRMPHKNSHGQYDNWSKTALPWMSIGYESQVPPISTLTFYNAIANGGVMVRPRFVTKVVKDGETLMEFPPEVIKPRICKESTLRTVQTVLEHVVSQGLGKKAGCSAFKVAGKTGTAQISKGSGGYKGGAVNYLLSFAGYFPADNPRYSCIVCIQKTGLPASGGNTSGVVFHKIAEGIMAQHIKLDVSDAKEPFSIFTPDVKSGNILAADYVLTHLGVNTAKNWSGDYLRGNPVWGKAQTDKGSVRLDRTPVYSMKVIPDVHGMGARDAVYLLESRGVKVRLKGRGTVKRQSLPPGHVIRRGERCDIDLDL